MFRKLQLMIFILGLTLGLTFTVVSAAAAKAPPVKRTIVTLENGTKAVVDISRGKPSAPVFVLLNGLRYDTNRWDPVTELLVRSGATVVRVPLTPQPENLRLLESEPDYFESGLELRDMAEDLAKTLDAVRITQPVHLVPLSYSAGVATAFAKAFPKRVKKLIYVAPLIVPLDNYNPEGRALRTWLESVRFWENTPCDWYGAINPWACSARDYWYDAFYDNIYGPYLDKRVQNIPPDIDERTYKKAVFHMVRAARDLDLRKDTPQLKNVFMLVGGNEEKQMLADQLKAWQAAPQANRGAFIVFEGAEHALPDEAPARLAEVLTGIANGRAAYAQPKMIKVRADE